MNQEHCHDTIFFFGSQLTWYNGELVWARPQLDDLYTEGYEEGGVLMRDILNAKIDYNQKIEISDVSGLPFFETDDVRHGEDNIFLIKQIHYGTYHPEKEDIERKKDEYFSFVKKVDCHSTIILSNEERLSDAKELMRSRKVLGILIEYWSKKIFETKEDVKYHQVFLMLRDEKGKRVNISDLYERSDEDYPITLYQQEFSSNGFPEASYYQWTASDMHYVTQPDKFTLLFLFNRYPHPKMVEFFKETTKLGQRATRSNDIEFQTKLIKQTKEAYKRNETAWINWCNKQIDTTIPFLFKSIKYVRGLLDMDWREISVKDSWSC